MKVDVSVCCVFLVVVVVAPVCFGWSTTSLMTAKYVANSLEKGGRCLDGSPAGYWFRPAQSQASTNKWIIFLHGGGWCYDEEDCYQRSLTALGSSKLWAKEYNGSAILSGNPSINPDFYDWNAAYVWYCDGASFSGNREDPLMYQGKNLWFRGHQVLDVVLDDLNENGMSNATHVLLTGCSAGGLSTFLHADYVQTKLPPHAMYKAMPESGFFLAANNVDNKPVYIDQMKYVYHMQNVSGSTINSDCASAYNESEQWKCIFAPFTYPYVKTPIFVLNSYYDSWQMGNIVFVDVQNASDCAYHGPSTCQDQQIAQAGAFHDSFLQLIKGADNFDSSANGAFLHSCWTHCAGSSDAAWISYKISDKQMREAVGDWFFNRATQNTRIGCSLHSTAPYQCNPSCGDH